MARLTVIADDLTGALDTGVQFANRCVSVRVAAVHGTAAVHEELFQADVAVIDAEVRHRSRQEAYKICLELVQQALRCGTDSVYIKTDSGLRGNIGAMFQAALDASGAAAAYYAPALPRMNRLTRAASSTSTAYQSMRVCSGKIPLSRSAPLHKRPFQKLSGRGRHLPAPQSAASTAEWSTDRHLRRRERHGLPVHWHGTAAHE